MTISRVSKDCMPCHRHIKKWAWTRSILWKHFYCTTSGGARRAPWRPKRPKQASRSLSRVFCRSDVTQNIISKDSQISKYYLIISITSDFFSPGQNFFPPGTIKLLKIFKKFNFSPNSVNPWVQPYYKCGKRSPWSDIHFEVDVGGRHILNFTYNFEGLRAI